MPDSATNNANEDDEVFVILMKEERVTVDYIKRIKSPRTITITINELIRQGGDDVKTMLLLRALVHRLDSLPRKRKKS